MLKQVKKLAVFCSLTVVVSKIVIIINIAFFFESMFNRGLILGLSNRYLQIFAFIGLSCYYFLTINFIISYFEFFRVLF